MARQERIEARLEKLEQRFAAEKTDATSESKLEGRGDDEKIQQ